MDRHEFSDSAPGRLVPTGNPRPDVQVAFVPDPLPPSWQWPHRLWPKLIEARTRLASLGGTGKYLQNPEIILTPLQHREAQLSSRLEGTFTDPQQQALFQADPRYPTSDRDPINPYREVFNYGRALRLRQDGSLDLPLSLRLILKLHAVLMDGVRGSDQRPGEFRTIQNQIGHPARFVPPPPQYLGETLDAFERYLHVDYNPVDPLLDPLVRAFLAHYQFEAIHPFRDGNGRIGRLLLAMSVTEWCQMSNQWLYMSPFFERRKTEYMDLMLNVSTHNGWEEWIEFCLDGVIEQAADTERRCEILVQLHREFHDRIRNLKGGSVRLARLIDDLFIRPVLAVKTVQRECGVAYATARSDLRKLESLGIIKRLDDMQYATYYCDHIYRVTAE